MRFAELPPGARFEFEGRIYTKTNSLTATDEMGKPRLIPRSATIRPLDETNAAAELSASPLPAERVRAALDHYHARCIALLDRLPEDTRDKLRTEFEQARTNAEKMLFG